MLPKTRHRFDLFSQEVVSLGGAQTRRWAPTNSQQASCTRCVLPNTACIIQDLIKSNLSLYSLYYTKACNKYAGPISASLRPSNTVHFGERLERWRTVGNNVSDLTGLRFESLPSSSTDERVIARPTNQSQDLR